MKTHSHVLQSHHCTANLKKSPVHCKITKEPFLGKIYRINIAPEYFKKSPLH